MMRTTIATMLVLTACSAVFAQIGPTRKLPTGVILVKGAEPSASDAATPLPESGRVVDGKYVNRYFGLTVPLPAGWREIEEGPPPSDSGDYVLAQIATSNASLLITAQDEFFAAPGDMHHLAGEFTIEHEPRDVLLGGRTFSRMDYTAPAAGLHWRVLSTRLRCHRIRFTFTSRDAAALEKAIATMHALHVDDADAPACVADYASGANVVHRVDVALTDRKFNSIPVRITIKPDGSVAHVHVISAFPQQAKTITDALKEWKFTPYLRGSVPVPVETGIVFGAPLTLR